MGFSDHKLYLSFKGLSDFIYSLILFSSLKWLKFTLIDNNFIKDQDKITELFDTVISINKDAELKNLVIFKKGLYFSDKLQENELLEILKPIINSESIWKQHALLLMGDFYFYNKKFNKAKEFFSKIIELKNVNPKIKSDVEKRLNRDFSE